ncbi:hypothetical protein K438DRAFT_1778165 [Mycena galopus ATCC 62051]|nr:hypothetical protein K438DRAFT_1778165 [Mycena galopus ATCC 62051]
MPGVSTEEEVLVKWFLGPSSVRVSTLCSWVYWAASNQLLNYYNWYADDNRGLRIAVAVLCLLSVLKSAETFASLWIFLIDHFGNIEYDLSLSTTAWWDTANPLMVASINFYVQCFYLYRLWGVSKRWWVVAPISALFIFSMMAIVLATYFITIPLEKDVSTWFGAHLGTALGETVPQRAALQLNPMFANLSWGRHPHFDDGRDVQPDLLADVQNQQPAARAISMMWTLNAPRAIRARNGLSASGSRSGSDGPSGWRVRTPCRTNDDVELGPIGVLKHTQTTQQVDVTEMFHHSTIDEEVKHNLSSGDHKIHSEAAQFESLVGKFHWAELTLITTVRG